MAEGTRKKTLAERREEKLELEAYLKNAILDGRTEDASALYAELNHGRVINPPGKRSKKGG